MPKSPLDKTTYCSYSYLEWDLSKNENNIIKHRVSFEQAIHVFNEVYFEIPDNRKDYREDRYIVLGNLLGHIVVLVYTPRNDRKRIISLRKANEREKKIYKQRVQSLGCNG
jgi:uncharacterized DUF497 family protein